MSGWVESAVRFFLLLFSMEIADEGASLVTGILSTRTIRFWRFILLLFRDSPY